ncbi:glucosamine-6-phosphate deaminase [Gordonia sp. (in: high G+C Gram-positive bacteria)]|uniref:glucosamine-6-phosphate deaminase n=1 Tax=Gordonia sp. (in: high G+C Gram-positive bacteria) TaxID=84139 RepID=UPI003C771583
MEIVIVDHPEQVMADIIANAVRGGASVLGLATGSSPLRTYTELIRRHREEGLSFAGVDAVLLDEYVGLPTTHPESYARFIRDKFTDHVDIGEVNSPDGMTDDSIAAADAYDDLIKGIGPVDVQILGIGSNGHIGFNEPSSSLTSRTRIKTLTAETRNDNARFFDSFDEVPQHVITQGLGTICDAKHLALVATGEGKADAIARAVEGPLSASCPASILQWHPRATVVIDNAAASKLKDAEYYKYVYANKPR